MEGSASALLPTAHHVPRWVTEGRDPQVPLGVRSQDDLATVCLDHFHRVVDALDIDVGEQARLASDAI
jgi:hypothetical protein